jgi:HAD superfamily hydrolase (TIGR01509 family)
MPYLELPFNMPVFYSAVFFDMDGLFVNSEPVWLVAETELMARYGYEWTTDDQNACLGGPLSRVGEYMFEKAGGKESPQFFTDEVISLMSKKLVDGVPAMPGALELLNSLKNNGIKTALVSASPRVLVDSVLNRFSDHSFEFSLSADDVKHPKPNPEAYLAAANRLNVEISNCLILEDSPNGVTAATSSGAFTIAVPHFVAIDPRPRLRVIKSLEELNYLNLFISYEQDRLV